MTDCLDTPATLEGFGSLVGVSKQAVGKVRDKGVLPRTGTLREWLLAYCERLRDEAAGRGGDDQVNLSRARAEEAQVKAALGRLQYHERLGALVPAATAEEVLTSWAGYANREVANGWERLVQWIEAEHGVTIDRDAVKTIAGPCTERIRDYAGELGRGLGARGGEAAPEAEGIDSGVAQH